MAGASIPYDFDAVVVGAGAVGLACAYALAQRGLSVVVLEKNEAIGQGISSRNSEVIHGGLYYPTGSLKARFCVQGRRRLYAFLDAHGVAYDRCGKLVVATEDSEIERVEAIARQALENDVEGIATLTGAQVRALEPELRVVMAVASPESGLVDSHGYMLALEGEIGDRGGAVVVATPFEGAKPLAFRGCAVAAGGAEPTQLTCRLLVIAGGLGAQDAAAKIEHLSDRPHPEAPLRQRSLISPSTGRPPFRRLIASRRRSWARSACTIVATWAARRGSGRIWLSSTTRTIASIPPGRRGSLLTSAASGPACPTARSPLTTRVSGPSFMALASPSRTSASTVRRCTASTA